MHSEEFAEESLFLGPVMLATGTGELPTPPSERFCVRRLDKTRTGPITGLIRRRGGAHYNT